MHSIDLDWSHLSVLLAVIGGILGLGSGAAAVWLLRRFPAAWLLDYGEIQAPDDRMGRHPARMLPGWGIPAHGIHLALVGAVMLGGAGSFGQLGLKQGIGLFLLLWILTLLSLADLACRILPDQLILALVLFGLLAQSDSLSSSLSSFLSDSLLSSLMGALCGGGPMLLLGFLGGVCNRQEVLGFGDVKLMAALGFCLGSGSILTILPLSLLLLGIVAAILLTLGRIRPEHSLPLAPCVLAAVSLSLLYPILPALPIPEFLL